MRLNVILTLKAAAGPPHNAERMNPPTEEENIQTVHVKKKNIEMFNVIFCSLLNSKENHEYKRTVSVIDNN